MNIYPLDKDPVRAAELQCDKHVLKNSTEIAQILCTAADYMRYPGTPYEPCNMDKFARWVMKSRANWDWAILHGFALNKQFRLRKGRGHRSIIAMCWIRNLDPYEHEWEATGLTPFADGTYPRRDLKLYPSPSADLVVELYREYYARKEAVWAEKATERCLEFIRNGSHDVSKGRRPTMVWSPPASRPEWMPDEVPDWRPSDDQIHEARCAVVV